MPPFNKESSYQIHGFGIQIFKRNPSLSEELLPIPQFSFPNFLTDMNICTNLLASGMKESSWSVSYRIKPDIQIYFFSLLLKFCFGFVYIKDNAERIFVALDPEIQTIFIPSSFSSRTVCPSGEYNPDIERLGLYLL